MARRAKRTRWTRAEAVDLLGRWAASGLTLAEFARRRGVGYERLRRWQSKLGTAAAPPFARVEVTSSPGPVRGESAITVELRNGMRLVASGVFDADAVARLASALESAC